MQHRAHEAHTHLFDFYAKSSPFLACHMAISFNANTMSKYPMEMYFHLSREASPKSHAIWHTGGNLPSSRLLTEWLLRQPPLNHPSYLVSLCLHTRDCGVVYPFGPIGQLHNDQSPHLVSSCFCTQDSGVVYLFAPPLVNWDPFSQHLQSPTKSLTPLWHSLCTWYNP